VAMVDGDEKQYNPLDLVAHYFVEYVFAVEHDGGMTDIVAAAAAAAKTIVDDAVICYHARVVDVVATSIHSSAAACVVVVVVVVVVVDAAAADNVHVANVTERVNAPSSKKVYMNCPSLPLDSFLLLMTGLLGTCSIHCFHHHLCIPLLRNSKTRFHHQQQHH